MLEESELRPLTPAISTVTTATSGQASHSALLTPSGQSAAIGTPGFSVSPLLADYTPSPQIMNLQDRVQTYLPGTADERQIVTEPPMERLVKAINTMSSRALASAIGDIDSIISLSDKLGGSAPGTQSRAAVGEDLAQVTKCRSQARVLSSPDGSAINRKVKRRIDSMALSLLSSDGSVVNSLQRLSGSDLETESTATSRVKRPKVEISLDEEINYVNGRFIDTHVEIDHDGSEEAAADGREGIVVTCSYNAIAMEPNTAFHGNLFHLAVPPLRLLIPPYYPHCSPIVLEDHTASSSNHPISCQARDAFRRIVRSLQQPVSLGGLVRAWDASAHSAVVEAATLQGGGCFSSSYGSWEYCVNV